MQDEVRQTERDGEVDWTACFVDADDKDLVAWMVLVFRVLVLPL